MRTIHSLLIISLFSPIAIDALAFENIGFESPDEYKSIGVYDVWENSPFMTGELKGNYSVTENPFVETDSFTGQIDNPSSHVVGLQRSRFGSNRFGVRVDLNEPFDLTPQFKYVHVMLHKPVEGRVMLVGLGSRKERKDQNPYTEQFWVLSDNSIKPDTWNDAVFPIKGAEGIEIRSLVVVPDCESPHQLNEDFLCYIDNILVSESSTPRIINEYYPISGNKQEKGMTRKDRYASGIKLKTPAGEQEISFNQQTNKKLYQDLTGSYFFAKPGETLTPEIVYNNDWMHAYCYIDFNNDGNFDSELTSGGIPVSGSELVSFNYFDGLNSKGERANNNLGESTGKMPSFTLPDNLKPGVYRIRYKIDWDNIDPKGSSVASGNDIAANGGVIADAMLFVYDDIATVNDYQLNGEILTGTGEKLNAYKAKSDVPFIVKSAPEKGFHNGGIKIKAGYNLDNEERLDKFGNPQYMEVEVPASAFNKEGLYTIPAEYMRGNVLINGSMLEN